MALDRNYDSPEYNVTHIDQYDRVGITSSTLYFAQFIARARMYVTNIVVGIRSVASLAALTVIVGHGTSAAAAFSAVAGTTNAWISATSVGSYNTITLNRTLASGEKLGLVFTDAKGKVYVSYEYQLLPA
ncbi:MAG: hypothetical protein FJX76_01435 [Armatimonadetes bacterium]|nr:hypothetical protein [Armatimonadota bacterium]